MFKVDIYIETSIKGPVRRKGWYAAVLVYKKYSKTYTRHDYGMDADTTYVQSALNAMIASLKRLNTNCEVTIHTDCTFIFNAIKQNWLRDWEHNGYLSVNGHPVANKKEWQQISKLIKNHKVTFKIEEVNAYSEEMKVEAKARWA